MHHQLAINLATGHGLLETSHELNIYNLMYSLNWYKVGSLELPSSIIEVIRQDPVRFFAKYVTSVF